MNGICEFQVIEDNGGGMYLFVFNDGKVIYGAGDVEHACPGDLETIAVEDWEYNLDNPQEVYDNITSYQFGWKVVKDQNGVYPERMGRAAQRILGD